MVTRFIPLNRSNSGTFTRAVARPQFTQPAAHCCDNTDTYDLPINLYRRLPSMTSKRKPTLLVKCKPRENERIFESLCRAQLCIIFICAAPSIPATLPQTPSPIPTRPVVLARSSVRWPLRPSAEPHAQSYTGTVDVVPAGPPPPASSRGD